METIIQHHESVAVLVARVFLGLLFFFQGYDAVFRVKIPNVIEAYKTSFADKGIPVFLTVSGAWFTSLTELIGGILLIFGLFHYWSLYFLGIDLVIASVAFGIVLPMWDMRFVFPPGIAPFFTGCSAIVERIFPGPFNHNYQSQPLMNAQGIK